MSDESRGALQEDDVHTRASTTHRKLRVLGSGVLGVKVAQAIITQIITLYAVLQ